MGIVKRVNSAPPYCTRLEYSALKETVEEIYSNTLYQAPSLSGLKIAGVSLSENYLKKVKGEVLTNPLVEWTLGGSVKGVRINGVESGLATHYQDTGIIVADKSYSIEVYDDVNTVLIVVGIVFMEKFYIGTSIEVGLYGVSFIDLLGSFIGSSFSYSGEIEVDPGKYLYVAYPDKFSPRFVLNGFEAGLTEVAKVNKLFGSRVVPYSIRRIPNSGIGLVDVLVK